MVKLGYGRTSEGGIRGVDLQGDDAILLCCNRSIYKDISGDEKVTKVVEEFDLCELIQVGDYVNGYRVDDINVQGRIIYCDDFKKEFTPEQVEDIVSKERFESVKFVLQRAKNRAKEIDEKGW